MMLELFKGDYAVCNLNSTLDKPIFIDTKDFYYITNIKNQLSVICLDENIPEDIERDKEWKIIKVLEPITLYLVGMLKKIEKVLNDAQINIFEISTDTNDYIMIKSRDIEYACRALASNGYNII